MIGELRSYRAILDGKKAAIEKELADFPPTVVVSCPEGIYVFASEVTKVHSTIVLAGAGQTFGSIADGFRSQISDLVINWGPNVPRADVEGPKLLTPVFHSNLDASNNIVVADIVVVELGTDENKDYVARVDFLGKVKEFKKNVVVLSYHVVDDEDENVEGKDNGVAQKDNDIKEGLSRVAREELVKLNLASAETPESFTAPDFTEEFLRRLKSSYPGKKGFLRRDYLKKKSYSWIYETP